MPTPSSPTGAAAAQTPGTKQQRAREHILRHAPVTFRLADIRTAVPGVSDQTIRLVLEQLRNEGRVRADGTRPLRDVDPDEYRNLRVSALRQQNGQAIPSGLIPCLSCQPTAASALPISI